MADLKKTRVVIDTNILISAILVRNSFPGKLLQMWKDDLFILLISQGQLDEIEEVSKRKKFHEKYHAFAQKVDELIIALRMSAVLVKELSLEKLKTHSRDPKDVLILAAAYGGKADYLITGDADLLALRNNSSIGDLKIISTKDFINQ